MSRAKIARRNDAPLPRDLCPEDRRCLFDQERENHRYQDGLRWSRIQTVSIIEGGMLWGIFWQPVNNFLSLVVAIGGSLMSFAVCLMALKDASDARWHIDRVRQLEEMMGIEVAKARAPQFWMRIGNAWRLIVWGAFREEGMSAYREHVPSGTNILEWAVRLVVLENLLLVIYCLGRFVFELHWIQRWWYSM